MTDQAPETTETTVADPADAPSAEPDANGTTEGDARSDTSPHREAAKWRTQFREAEAALATAQARIERYHVAELERLAASAGLSHPSDVMTLSGNSVSDYLDPETGDIDAEKVAADVAAILSERPGLRRPSPATDPSQGHGWGPVKRTPTWEALLKP